MNRALKLLQRKAFCEKIKFVSATGNDIKKFQKVFTDEEKKKYMDPFGFLNPLEGKFIKLLTLSWGF